MAGIEFMIKAMILTIHDPTTILSCPRS